MNKAKEYSFRIIAHKKLYIGRHGDTYLYPSTLEKVRQEFHKFEASLSQIARPCLKNKNNNKQQKKEIFYINLLQVA
jgi:hypothetical protein